MTALALEAPRTSVPIVRSSTRLDTLDWIKGVLILCMVAYHSLNYSAYRPFGYRYLSFLPPSFILITGFLVTQVYAQKYDLATWKPYARLAIRGFKLLVLFTLLNLVYCIALQGEVYDGVLEFAERSGVIFLSGNGRTGIFEVLLPISYFLLLSPFLLWAQPRAWISIPVAALAVFLLCWYLEITGTSSKNLALLSAGFIGAALGLARMETINRFCTNWLLVGGLYLAYRIAVYFLGDSYPVQMVGVVITVLVINAFALRLTTTSSLGRETVLFGQYSLFAYLVQIALLQVIVKVIGGKPTHWLGVLLVGLTTTALLFAAVRLVHTLRERNQWFNSLYRFVFA